MEDPATPESGQLYASILGRRCGGTAESAAVDDVILR